MKNQDLVSCIVQDTHAITQLHDEIKHTLKNRAENPQAWKEACRIFHESYDGLAYPGGLAQGLIALKEQDPAAITTAIAYLKADPYFFRSGYIKQKVARLLKQASLTHAQIQELQDILIVAIQHDRRREYLEYCRLARKIADQKFRMRIQEIVEESDDAHMANQAQIMLNALQEN